MKKNYLFFDLDGTLIDSAEGIFHSLNYALEEMDRTRLDEATLRTFIGPPLRESLMRIGLNSSDTEKAVSLYQEEYARKGKELVTVYPGIAEVLAQLAETKHLFIATSKPEYFAKQILDQIGLAQYFTGIYGADLAGSRSAKAAVLAYALTEAQVSSKEAAVMIGDRKHDILGAKANGLESIGVLYGFGEQEELASAGANLIVAETTDLLKVIQ